MGTKICVGNYVGDNYYRAKFYPNWFTDFVSACVISRPLGQSDSANFLGEAVLEKGYRRDYRTDFDAEYVIRRGSAQGSVFFGSRNQYLRFRLPFFPKAPFWGPTGLINFWPENGFNIKRLESKRPLIVVVDGRSVDGRTARSCNACSHVSSGDYLINCLAEAKLLCHLTLMRLPSISSSKTRLPVFGQLLRALMNLGSLQPRSGVSSVFLLQSHRLRSSRWCWLCLTSSA